MLKAGMVVVALASAGVATMQGQGEASKAAPALAGTWQLAKGKVSSTGPKTVVIRPDSSASWGKETVRWRVTDDQIMIAIGGEWEVYRLKLRGDRMTLSGGDLTEDITLRRVGPHSPRPDSVPIPPDPGPPVR